MATPTEAGALMRLRAALAARFRLHDNWRALARHAWSIRFSLAAAVLSGLEVGGNLIASSPPMPLQVYAAGMTVITTLAALARLFAQANVAGDA